MDSTAFDHVIGDASSQVREVALDVLDHDRALDRTATFAGYITASRMPSGDDSASYGSEQP